MLISNVSTKRSYAYDIFTPADVAFMICWFGSFLLTVLSGKRRETFKSGSTTSEIKVSSWSRNSSRRPPCLRPPRVESRAPTTSRTEPLRNLSLILYFLSPTNALKSEKHYFYIKLLILNAMMILSTSSSAYIARAAIYTDIYSVLTLPSIYKLYPPFKYRSYRSLFIIFYSFFWLVEVTRRETLLPFRWVFQR